MNGEDNIGKKIRERLADHHTPVSGKVWENIQSSLPGNIPVPSSLASPLSEAWMKLLYAISSISVVTVLTFVVPTFSFRSGSNGERQSAEKPVAHTQAPPPAPATSQLPSHALQPAENSQPMAKSTQRPPSQGSFNEKLPDKEEAKLDKNVQLTDNFPPGTDAQPTLRVSQPGQPEPVSGIPSLKKQGKSRPESLPQLYITENQALATENSDKKKSALRNEKPNQQRLTHAPRQALTLRPGKEKPPGNVAVNARHEKENPTNRSLPLSSSDLGTPAETNPSPFSPTTKLALRSPGNTIQVRQLPGISMDSIPIAVVRKSVGKRWSLDLLLNPVTTIGANAGSEEPGNRSGIQLSGGVRLNHRLSQHWLLSSGLWLDRIRWQNVYEVIYLDHNNNHLRGILQENNQTHYLGIPLTITYGSSSHRLGYSVTAGVQVDILTRSERNFSYRGMPIHAFPWLHEPNIYKTVVPMVTASAGLSYALTPRTSLLLEPRVAYMASSVYNAAYPFGQRLWQVGLTTGIRMTF